MKNLSQDLRKNNMRFFVGNQKSKELRIVLGDVISAVGF